VKIAGNADALAKFLQRLGRF